MTGNVVLMRQEGTLARAILSDQPCVESCQMLAIHADS